MRQIDSAPLLFATATKVSQPSSWFNSLVRQLGEMLGDRRNRWRHVEVGGAMGRDLFEAATRVSQSAPWFFSLRRQLYELGEERKHPRPKLEITAERDPAALEKLIEQPGPFSSLLSQIRGLVGDTLHPKKAATTAAPVEVEEIWSKTNTAFPRLVSAGIHVMLIALVL